MMQQQYAKRNEKVRFRDPLMFKKIQKYIHHDRIPNNKNEILLNRAMEKIGLSKRFKNIFHLDDEIAADNNIHIWVEIHATTYIWRLFNRIGG